MSILLDNVQSASYLTWSDKNSKYSRKTLPYVCMVKIGGESTIVKAEFVKLGKKSENYFTITIKKDFTILMSFGLHKTSNKFIEQFGLTPQLVGNETDIIWNHFSKGSLSYIKEADQSVLLIHALRHKLARYYTGDVKSGMVKRIKDLSEEEILTEWANIPEDVEPITTIKHYANIRLAEIKPVEDPVSLASEDQDIIDHHQKLADSIVNEPKPEETVRTNEPEPEPLPELTSFDDDANKVPEHKPQTSINLELQAKFATNPKTMVKKELITLASSLGLSANKGMSNDSIITLIDSHLLATV